MGNPVTNRISLSASSGAISEEDLGRLASILTGSSADEALKMVRAGEPGYGVWCPLTFAGVVPLLDITAAVPQRLLGLSDLALALSSSDVDYIALTSHEDPFEHLMPPEFSRTRIRVLERHGYGGLPYDEARRQAEQDHPGILEAGEALAGSVDLTGYSNPVAWREEHWGTRAHAEDALYLITDEGGFTVRFDTVNASPHAFIEALAKRFPDLQIQSWGYDEDTDYAFSAVNDGEPGEIYWVEEDSRDAVEEAIAFVHPSAGLNSNSEMEP